MLRDTFEKNSLKNNEKWVLYKYTRVSLCTHVQKEKELDNKKKKKLKLVSLMPSPGWI